MQLFLLIFSVLIISATLIPLVKKEYWVFRVFEYPRLQKLVANLLCVGLWALIPFSDTNVSTIFLILLVLNAIYIIYLKSDNKIKNESKKLIHNNVHKRN